MTLDEDIRAALDDALRPEGRLVPEPGISHLLLREGRRRVRTRRVLTATGSVAAVASVAVVVTAAGLIGHDGQHGAPLPPASGVSPTPSQRPTPSPTSSVIAGGCSAAAFTLPVLDPSTGVTPAAAATTGSYRSLPPGGKVTVATTSKGGVITLVRGVPNEDFAVSVYAHGAAALDPLGVLGSDTYLYPAEVTGAAGPRIPFATSADRVSNACDRWELQATGVEIPTLIDYGQEIEPIPSSTTVPCTDKALLPTNGEGSMAAPHPELVIIFTNKSNVSCTISGYPTISLRDPAERAVPVKIAHGSGSSYQDPGPAQVAVAPAGRASFAVTIELAGASKCSSGALLGITLPGQKSSFPEPVFVPSCQVSEITVTAMVAGGMGPPGR